MDSPPDRSGRLYPDPVEQPKYLSVDELAEQLGCAPDEALALARHVGPRGMIRTNDRRFLIPADVVEQLRAAQEQTHQ